MSLAAREGFIWMDGRWTPWADARVHVLSHALHYGTGVFEGVRAYDTAAGTAVFRLDDHVRRFFESAHILRMAIPFAPAKIARAMCEAVAKNKLSACYIRPLAFFGAGRLGISARNLPVHVAIAAWPWGTYLGEEALTEGIRVRTAAIARHHVNAAMARGKICGQYVNSVLAHAEAADADEALLLDVDGYVAEGSGENLFIAKRGALYTPALGAVLEGITRATVMQLAADAGVAVYERRLTRDDVYCADEAFFTGTAAEITPIRELDGRAVGGGKRGAITADLQKRFFACVKGRAKKYRRWLTIAAPRRK